MAEYQVGSAEAVNARRREELRAPPGAVHAVVGTPGTWAPAVCGAYVQVYPDPWMQGAFLRCDVCLTRVPVGD